MVDHYPLFKFVCSTSRRTSSAAFEINMQKCSSWCNVCIKAISSFMLCSLASPPRHRSAPAVLSLWLYACSTWCCLLFLNTTLGWIVSYWQMRTVRLYLQISWTLQAQKAMMNNSRSVPRLKRWQELWFWREPRKWSEILEDFDRSFQGNARGRRMWFYHGDLNYEAWLAANEVRMCVCVCVCVCVCDD